MQTACVPKTRVISNSTASALILLSYPAAIYANLINLNRVSLNPNPPRQCETLTIQWGGDEAGPGPFTINVFGESTIGLHPAQTLFQTVINIPTQSAEWPVSPASGAPVVVQVLGQGSSGLQLQGMAGFQVLSGESHCSTAQVCSCSLFVCGAGV